MRDCADRFRQLAKMTGADSGAARGKYEGPKIEDPSDHATNWEIRL
jgi:hypothetical protein